MEEKAIVEAPPKPKSKAALLMEKRQTEARSEPIRSYSN